MAETNTNLQDQFEAVLKTNDPLEIREFLNDLNISDVADLIYDNTNLEVEIISNLTINRAVGVFRILDAQEQKSIIKNLPSYRSAELLNELPADDRVDFFEELPTNTVRDLIKKLDPKERKVTLELLGYPENSVGRIMVPDYVYVYEDDSVKDVFEAIRKWGTNSETIDVIYVINHKGELLDDIKIRDFLLASPETKVGELMDDRFIALNVHDDQESANETFKINNRVALPVTDDNNILVGIVTIDDVLWIAEEEFSEDMQKVGGTEALDDPYLDSKIITLVRKRAPWLTILFVSELFTATAMQYFENEIAKATVLALFIPLIISSGGNSGSQASTLIIQAMALGEVTIKDWWRVFKRELISGFLLGLILGVMGFIRIYVWQMAGFYNYGSHWDRLALTLFLALLGIVLWGSLAGSMLPIFLKKIKLDPAVSSAPFVATLVDVTGIIIYFYVAYIVLSGTLL